MKKLYLLYTILVAIVFAPAIALAVNVSIPQSTAYGQLPVGNAAGGSYTPTATTSIKFFTLTTTGSSGAATYTSGTLNIPQYSGSGSTFSYLFPLNATSTALTFSAGLVSNGSTTVVGLGSGIAAANNGLLYSTATTTLVPGTGISFGGATPVIFGSSPITITSSGGAAADAFTHGSVWGQITSATTTQFFFNGAPFSLLASSTAVFTYASSTQLQTFGTTSLGTLGGNVGAGTTSPYAKFSIHTGSLETNLNLFAIGSSTATATTTLFSIANTGNITGSGALTLTSAGTSTFSGGVNLNGTDCFAVAGTCLQTFIQNATAYKQAVSYATNAVLAGSPTYANGSSGVGATLTEVGFGALSVDGQAPSVGQRILVKNEATQANNGIYTVTAAGSGVASYILTRATDYNQSIDIYAGTTVPVLVGGTANGDTQWTESTTGTIVVGTTAIVFLETSYGTNGTVTSVGLSSTNSTLSVGSTPVTTSGTITADLNLGHANWWTALQNFTNASSSQFTATSTLYIPNAASSPTLGVGAIAINTTAASSSLRFGDGTATRTLYPDRDSVFTFASSTLQYMGGFGASGSTTILLGNYNRPITLVNFFCKTDVGTALVRFGNGTTASTTQATCNTTGTEVGIPTASALTNNTFARRTNFKIELGTSASAPNNITVTADIKYDSD